MNKYNDYKECSLHPGVMMPLRTNADGKSWYSHGRKYKGQLVWCIGWGYKNPNKNEGKKYLPEPEEDSGYDL